MSETQAFKKSLVYVLLGLSASIVASSIINEQIHKTGEVFKVQPAASGAARMEQQRSRMAHPTHPQLQPPRQNVRAPIRVSPMLIGLTVDQTEIFSWLAIILGSVGMGTYIVSSMKGSGESVLIEKYGLYMGLALSVVCALSGVVANGVQSDIEVYVGVNDTEKADNQKKAKALADASWLFTAIGSIAFILCVAGLVVPGRVNRVFPGFRGGGYRPRASKPQDSFFFSY